MHELDPQQKSRIAKGVYVLIILLIVFVGLKSLSVLKGIRYVGHSATTNTITVSGEGFVEAVPDIATESISISEKGKTQKEAGDKMAVKEKSVLDLLKSSGIAEKDIKTEYQSVNPEYQSGPQIECFRYPCPQANQVIVGYISTENISVKIRNTDDVGKIIQGLNTIGVELSGPNYTIDNEDSLKQEARQNAIKDAKTKANALERDLGIHLGRIVNFSENGGGYPMMYSMKAEMAVSSDSGAPAPTLPTGQNKINSNVTITYEIN